MYRHLREASNNPTPVRTDDKPRAYSPVNILGQILGDATELRLIPDEEIERLIKSTRT
jgi:hypothetical protein